MFDPKTRILIVDDMLIMRKQIARVCNELGFLDLIEATDGVTALQLIQNEKPGFGLVITDYDMPKANGLDLFKRIRNDTRFGRIPFLFLALEAEEILLTEAIKSGASDCLLKPFNAEELKDKLNEIHKKVGR